MPEESRTIHPLGINAASEDQVGLAFRSVGTTVAFEIAWLSTVAWGTAALSRAQGITDKSQLSNSSAQVNLIILGTLASVFLGAGITWFLLSPVKSNFRRGGLAMVAALAGLMLAGVLSYLSREMIGVHAPLGLAALMALVTMYSFRAARASARALPSSQHR